MKDDISLHIPKLNNLAFSICKDTYLAEEAVSETILMALETNVYDFNELETICRKISNKSFNGSKHSKEILVASVSDDNYETGLNWDIVDAISAKNNTDTEELHEEQPITVSIIEQIKKCKTKDKYLPFEVARSFVRQLGFKTEKEYWNWHKVNEKELKGLLPLIISYYKDKGYVSMADFLGTEYYTYEQAKIWVQANLVPKGIDTSTKWGQNTNLIPKFIPYSVNEVYKDKGFISWVDFFGRKPRKSGKRVKKIPYNEFIDYVKNELLPKGIDTSGKYEKITHTLPPEIPGRPDKYYKVSWFTIFEKEKPVYCSCDEAKKWVQEYLVPLGINSDQKWWEYTKGKYPNAPILPINIPRSYYHIYPLEEARDWFGKQQLPNEWWTLDKCKIWVKVYLEGKIKTWKSWLKYIKGEIPGLPELNKNIPHSPCSAFKDKGWVSWKNFLGVTKGKEKRRDQNRKGKLVNFEKAKEYTQLHLVSKGIISTRIWVERLDEIPTFLPHNPCIVFRGKGWKGSDDFFGAKAKKIRDEITFKLRSKPRKNWKSFEETRKWIMLNLFCYGIKDRGSWGKYLKGEYPNAPELPDNIPHTLEKTYKDKWEGWINFVKIDIITGIVIAPNAVHIKDNMSGKKLKKLLSSKNGK